MGFICSLAWQVLVIWCATKVGFAMQVLDSVKIPVKDAGVCQSVGQAFIDGACRLTGRAVANLDGTWNFTPTDAVITLEHIRPGFLMYHPDSWHMTGGSLSTTALVIFTAVLLLVPVFFLKPKLPILKFLRGLAPK